MTSTLEPTTWVVESSDELDELFSDLLYMPSCVAIHPDGRLFEVWADADRGALVLRHLSQGSNEVIVTKSFPHALTLLAGARVLTPAP